MDALDLRELCDVSYATLVDHWGFAAWDKLDEHLGEFGLPKDETVEQQRQIAALEEMIGPPIGAEEANDG